MKSIVDTEINFEYDHKSNHSILINQPNTCPLAVDSRPHSCTQSSLTNLQETNSKILKIDKLTRKHQNQFTPIPPLPQSQRSINNTLGGCIIGMFSRQYGQKLKKKKRIGFRQGQSRRLLRAFCEIRAGVRCFPFPLLVVAETVWPQQPWGLGSQPSGQVTQHSISCPSRRFLSVVQIYTRIENSYQEKIDIKSFFFKYWLIKKAERS